MDNRRALTMPSPFSGSNPGIGKTTSPLKKLHPWIGAASFAASIASQARLLHRRVISPLQLASRQLWSFINSSMDIYANWLPKSWYYLVHLHLWMLPIALLQWAFFWKILALNWKPVLLVPLIVGSYLIATDVVAVYFGVWFFDENLILGWKPFGVPIEEWIFFYLTALLCVQSFVLFLPERLRHSSASRRTHSA
jgi:lycopene cyclase domain-containing protein